MKYFNYDKDLPAPCPAQAPRTRAGGPDSLLMRQGLARRLAEPARRPASPMAAPPAAFRGLPCPLPCQARIQPVWAVLTGRIGTKARAFRPAARPLPQA